MHLNHEPHWQHEEALCQSRQAAKPHAHLGSAELQVQLLGIRPSPVSLTVPSSVAASSAKIQAQDPVRTTARHWREATWFGMA